MSKFQAGSRVQIVGNTTDICRHYADIGSLGTVLELRPLKDGPLYRVSGHNLSGSHFIQWVAARDLRPLGGVEDTESGWDD